MSDFGQTSALKYLEALRQSVAADRAYVFEFHAGAESDTVLTSQRYECASEAADPQIDNPELQNVPFADMFPHWIETFERNQPYYGIVRTLPEVDREILGPQSILSLLVCPIVVGGDVWGFVGFDDCHREREWTRAERSALANGSRALAAALRHRAIKERLEVARAAVETMIASKDS